MRRLLFVLAALGAALSMILASCGGDDGPTKPPPPALEIGVTSINGDTLLGTMGSATLNKPLTFQVVDSSESPVSGEWVYFFLLAGDGTLSADSGITDTAGKTTVQYDFEGDLGYASIIALNPQYGGDTVELRASILTPGTNGQGQYVRFIDDFADIINLNGQQEGAAHDPRAPAVPIWYIEYEASKGVVFMVLDTGARSPDRVYSDSPVWGVIVNTVYAGTTKEGVGIGSSYSDIIAAFGTPDTVYTDTSQPPALVVSYSSVPPGNMQFFLDTVAADAPDTNTTAFEIHMNEAGNVAAPPILLSPDRAAGRIAAPSPLEERAYRLFHMR